MMHRTLRLIACWLRNRRPRYQVAPLDDIDALRARYLRQAEALTAEATAIFGRANAEECFAKSRRLFNSGMAYDHRAAAFRAMATGDGGTAAMLSAVANQYERQAEAPSATVAREPSHA